MKTFALALALAIILMGCTAHIQPENTQYAAQAPIFLGDAQATSNRVLTSECEILIQDQTCETVCEDGFCERVCVSNS